MRPNVVSRLAVEAAILSTDFGALYAHHYRMLAKVPGVHRIRMLTDGRGSPHHVIVRPVRTPYRHGSPSLVEYRNCCLGHRATKYANTDLVWRARGSAEDSASARPSCFELMRVWTTYPCWLVGFAI